MDKVPDAPFFLLVTASTPLLYEKNGLYHRHVPILPDLIGYHRTPINR